MQDKSLREVEKESLNYYKKNASSWSIIKTFSSYLFKQTKLIVLAFFCCLIQCTVYITGSILLGRIIGIFFQPYIEGSIPINEFNNTKFIIYLSILGSCFITYGIFRYIETNLYVRIGYRAAEQMRNELTVKLLKMPMSFYDKEKAGNLITCLTNDTNNIANSSYTTLIQLFSSILYFIGSIIAMFLISTVLTLIIVPLAIILYGIVMMFLLKSQKYFVATTNIFGRLNEFVEESISNTKVTNSFDQQKKLFKEIRKITKNIRNTTFKGDVIARSFDMWNWMISNTLILLISAISIIFYLNKLPIWGVYGLGASKEGYATPALIFTYVTMNWNFIYPFQYLLSITYTIQIGIASTNRVMRLLNLKEPNLSNETIEVKNIVGNIEFKNVWFKYLPESTKYQLKNAFFIAKPNTTTAIVGPTGAGKTTIINIISKFYDYNKGSVLLDENELKNIKSKELLNNMTIVSQESFLFNESIIDNLRIVNPNASDEEILNAAKLTKAHHFINTLPLGYATKIINNGANISQGEKQLLSLTRAMLSNKKIVILDEATSNIDSNTEKIVQESMLHLMKNKTVFVIAHRLSTIKNANNILVVDDGNIIEAGDHKTLLSKKGFYYNLYNSQIQNDEK